MDLFYVTVIFASAGIQVFSLMAGSAHLIRYLPPSHRCVWLVMFAVRFPGWEVGQKGIWVFLWYSALQCQAVY